MEILIICLLVLSTIVMLVNIYVVYILFRSMKLNRKVNNMNDIVMAIGELNIPKEFRVKDLKDNTYRGWNIRTLVDENKDAFLELQLLN